MHCNLRPPGVAPVVLVFNYMAHNILISIHKIQCSTRQTEAEQYIQEEHTKYSKILIYKPAK